jgi:uncharacterized membrane protein
MYDITFKVLSVIMFIAGVVFKFTMPDDAFTGTILMILGVFIFILAQILAELRLIREKMEKKG